MFRKISSFSILGVYAVLASCSEPPAIQPGKVTASVSGEYDATKGFKYIDPRPTVSAFMIDETPFKINGAQVGVLDYLDFETPVISYFLPTSADYVEILRCPSSVGLVSPDGSLINVEMGSKSADELSKALKDTDFWLQAENSGKCTLVAAEYNISSIFNDEFAPSGSMYYLLRACVEPARLSDTKFLGTRNCSHQIGLTLTMDGYNNGREQKTRDALENAANENEDG